MQNLSQMLPANETPATTKGLKVLSFNSFKGDVSKQNYNTLFSDHDAEKFENRKNSSPKKQNLMQNTVKILRK